MNTWQEQFSKKVEVIRIASRDRFEEIALEIILPIFEDYSEFTRTRGLQATSPLPTSGMRTFKFAITENAYVLMTFRLSGLESCEAHAEFLVPNHEKVDALREVARYRDVEAKWTMKFFEKALDRFMDTYLESLGEKAGIAGELINV